MLVVQAFSPSSQDEEAGGSLWFLSSTWCDKIACCPTSHPSPFSTPAISVDDLPSLVFELLQISPYDFLLIALIFILPSGILQVFML